jgi:hypothetical protein
MSALKLDLEIPEQEYTTMVPMQIRRVRRCSLKFFLPIVLVCCVGAQRVAGQEIAAFPQLPDVADTAKLLKIEQHTLPPVLTPGPYRFDNLPAYYMDANPELRQRFDLARQAFENEGGPRPLRSVTLIAGAAGVGKTFIKGEIFSKNYPKEKVCRFDLRELYEQWQQAGHTEPRSDLQVGDLVLNHLLAQKDLSQQRLTSYLREQQEAAFYVIDSLDEIHPDDYVALLREIERFALDGERDFVHVVVLGRGLSFREYWHSKANTRTPGQLGLFMLHPPRFLTTGDLLVSSWNYHTWACKLAWSPGGQQEAMSLEDYIRWVRTDYPLNGPFRSVSFRPNRNMDARVQGTLQDWACRYPVVGSMLYNLAGNTMVREIGERFVAESLHYDERSVMEEYLAAWLTRDTGSDGRPSAAKPEYLDLYLQLLEGVAVKYLAENRVDEQGFFDVAEKDTIPVDCAGKRYEVPVRRILNRSGLKYIDPREPGPVRYRFEPVWFHRLLVEKHNDRASRSLVADSSP